MIKGLFVVSVVFAFVRTMRGILIIRGFCAMISNSFGSMTARGSSCFLGHGDVTGDRFAKISGEKCLRRDGFGGWRACVLAGSTIKRSIGHSMRI